MRSNSTSRQATDGLMTAGSPAGLHWGRWKLALLLGALALVVVTAVTYVVAVDFLRPPAYQQRTLAAGDVVGLRSGLTLVVPPASSGFLEGWRSLDEELGNERDLAESGVIDVPGSRGRESIGLSVVWEPSKDPLSNTPARRWLFETGDLARAPSESGIVVRWRKPSPVAGQSNVYIVAQLPNRLPGIIGFEDREAIDARHAWDGARKMWQRLSISGAAFPGPPPQE
jgi:hypothetical protein